MCAKTADNRCKERMRCNRWSGVDAEPLTVRAHHLICAVCARGGCKTPPPGQKAIDRLLKTIWAYPYASLKICADVDIQRAHYSDVYEGRGRKALPDDFPTRNDEYVWRKRDLEVCRILGIVPNTEMPAFFVYTILFQRLKDLKGVCTNEGKQSKHWPDCPHAKKGYYKKIATARRYGLMEQTECGERMDGHGLWAMLRPRTREDMKKAKERSAKTIMQADHLYIRPLHVLCLLCRPTRDALLIEDNLIEMMRKMDAEPDIPVTLTEGCCQACDPCNEYHAGEHLCYHTHIKNSLRDLLVLERLGLPPGATLKAKDLYKRVYERIGSLKEICGWRDGSDTGPLWAPCAYDAPYLENARKEGFLAGGK